ncbi:MAG: zinc ribbon domain-containing protein [Candidatus Bathyarchaeota archaeon]|nr:zinc ribbon domain-containing protein [Candidatus Bathyarchaeota archaeon]
MPFCRKCGAELEPDDSFCPYCGAVFTPAKPQRTSTEEQDTATLFTEPEKGTTKTQHAPDYSEDMSTIEEIDQGKHTGVGYMGIIMGLIGVATFFIPVTQTEMLAVAIIDMFIALAAGSWGGTAIDDGDKNGYIALFLALIILAMCLYIFWTQL